MPTPRDTEIAGTVDENGLLWKSTQVGKFTDSFGGCANLYDSLAESAKKNGDKPAAGLRQIVSSEMVGGFEKLKMATAFDWLTYAEYLKEVDDLASGMVKAIPTCRSRAKVPSLAAAPAATHRSRSPPAWLRGHRSARAESTRRMDAETRLQWRSSAGPKSPVPRLTAFDHPGGAILGR